MGRTLAACQPVMTVYANLTLCSNRVPETTRIFAPLLQTTEAELIRKMRADHEGTNANKKAVVLKRNVPLEEWQSITNALARQSFGLDLRKLTRQKAALLTRLQQGSLFAQEEQLRIHPYANSLMHVLGFAARAGDSPWLEGLFGVEGALDPFLRGAPGLCVSKQDAAGRELPFFRQHYLPPVPGDHVRLTIDLRIQQIAELALATAVDKHHPKNASVIVTRPTTGEILAWACWPELDPLDSTSLMSDAGRNHALSDKLEPGSTFKFVVLAAAMNEGLVTLDDWIFCENGRFTTNGVVVHDHAAYGWLTIRQAVAKSSNIAFAKLALRLGADRLHRYIIAFGFGQKSGVPLVGETPGYVPSLQACSSIATLTRLGFGQGLGVSQLQMTLAMGAICNDGCLMRPQLIKQIETSQNRTVYRTVPETVRSVLNPRVARGVREALEAVLATGGTGVQAKLKSHSGGGKTGTAQKADKHGYLPDRYYSSFIGFVPANEPEICISVSLDEPRIGHYGGSLAAPVCRVIAEQVVELLAIPPDKGQPSSFATRPTPPPAVVLQRSAASTQFTPRAP